MNILHTIGTKESYYIFEFKRIIDSMYMFLQILFAFYSYEITILAIEFAYIVQVTIFLHKSSAYRCNGTDKCTLKKWRLPKR